MLEANQIRRGTRKCIQLYVPILFGQYHLLLNRGYAIYLSGKVFILNPDDNTEQYVLPAIITTNALKFEGNMEDGDQNFAVSEIQAFGTPVPSGVSLFSSALLMLPLAVLAAVLVVLNRRKTHIVKK